MKTALSPTQQSVLRDIGLKHYLRVGCATPFTTVGDPRANLREHRELIRQAVEADVEVLVFPELSLTGYSIRDMVFQADLLESAWSALCDLAHSIPNGRISFVGLPIDVHGKLFNAGAVITNGFVIALFVKDFLPQGGEFEEGRWYRLGNELASGTVYRGVPVLSNMILEVTYDNGKTVRIAPEICESSWHRLGPGAFAAEAGADLIVSLNGSNYRAGKRERREQIFGATSWLDVVAFAYSCTGPGEDVKDHAWDAHSMIIDNGEIIAESERFTTASSLIVADVDLDALRSAKRRDGARGSANGGEDVAHSIISVDVTLGRSLRSVDWIPRHPILRRPYVPGNPGRLKEIVEAMSTSLGARCLERKKATGEWPTMTLGLSGGCDSLLALLDFLEASHKFGIPKETLVVYRLPNSVVSTDRTQDNSARLVEALALDSRTIDIRAMAELAIRSVDHEPCWDCLTCENAQARVRMLLLQTGGMVIGTSNLTETDVGWCTYGADNLPMYNPMGSLPKTLVKELIRFLASDDNEDLPATAKGVIYDILATPASPELRKSQSTEASLGPMEVLDFLSHALKRGEAIEKTVLRLIAVFNQSDDAINYEIRELLDWIVVHRTRFMAMQYKRDVAPNGPLLGPDGASPRSVLRWPSNGSPDLWLQKLQELARRLA